VTKQAISKEEMAALREEHKRLLSEENKDKESYHICQQESQLCDMQYSKVLSKVRKVINKYRQLFLGLKLLVYIAVGCLFVSALALH
jgi:uncharacterized protein (DUF3084 family)